MNPHSEYVYCFIDNDSQFFKIGISDNPWQRVNGMGYGVSMKILFCLKLSVKHAECAVFLDKNGYRNTSSRMKVSPDYFFSRIRKHTLKIERIFKKKFKDSIYWGSEFFKYDMCDVHYVRNLFLKLSQSETTAVCQVDFIEAP